MTRIADLATLTRPQLIERVRELEADISAHRTAARKLIDQRDQQIAELRAEIALLNEGNQ